MSRFRFFMEELCSRGCSDGRSGPSADTAAMLFWALLASGQINMRKVDGWRTLATKLIGQPIDLAAFKRYLHSHQRSRHTKFQPNSPDGITRPRRPAPTTQGGNTEFYLRRCESPTIQARRRMLQSHHTITLGRASPRIAFFGFKSEVVHIAGRRSALALAGSKGRRAETPTLDDGPSKGTAITSRE
jgi:hypothetical protein